MPAIKSDAYLQAEALTHGTGRDTNIPSILEKNRSALYSWVNGQQHNVNPALTNETRWGDSLLSYCIVTVMIDVIL